MQIAEKIVTGNALEFEIIFYVPVNPECHTISTD